MASKAGHRADYVAPEQSKEAENTRRPGAAAELVKKADAGLACLPGDPKSIADAVEVLACMPRGELEAMGARGKKYYEQELSLSIGVGKFENILKTVADFS